MPKGFKPGPARLAIPFHGMPYYAQGLRRRDGDAATNQALSSRMRLLCRCRMSWGTANAKLASGFEKDTFLVCPGGRKNYGLGAFNFRNC
jgi:hypothetical protein